MGIFELLNKDKVKVRATEPKVQRMNFVYVLASRDLFHVSVSAMKDYNFSAGEPFMVAHFGNGHLEKLIRDNKHVLRNILDEDERRKGVRVFYESVVGYFGSVSKLEEEFTKMGVSKKFTNPVGLERLKEYERVFENEKSGSEMLAWYSASEEYWKGISL
jgi:hypothetical protein